MTPDIHDILKQYWGYDAFRPLQEDIIQSVIDGHDTLGLLPTGGGKSITFQVPAIALGGLTLVVTPLISLMKDQKDHLVERGVKAAAIYMGMTHQEVLDTYERVIADDYRLLYLSPERLDTPLFKAKLQYMDVRLLVVDEAHCISQWGYDFRPAYFKIAGLRDLLPPTVPCLALTATATAATIDDIRHRLAFREGSRTLRTSFERPNLTYSVMNVTDKQDTLRRMLDGVECGIVYVRSRRKTAEVAEWLTRQGISASFYHAGLTRAEKQRRQDAWMEGSLRVIVATNAFGMGIDKPNVRLVVHIDLPPSPEEYFQEAGRAGRDRQPARAVILTDRSDAARLRRHLTDEFPERDYIRMVYEKLAYFYQIGVGMGFNCFFEFDVMKFCMAYHLALSPTHYALRLLDQAGYIAYVEEPDRHSRVMFTTSRESLYHLNQFDGECQRVITALLRTYTGLFADYVYIREEDVMARTGLDRDTLYQKLLLLTRHHVLHYVPARQIPAIYYRTSRLETEEVVIPRTIYEDRRARQQARAEAMIAYVQNDRECRMVQLLRYFGEQADHRCGHCDACHLLDGGKHDAPDEGEDAMRLAIRDTLRDTIQADAGTQPTMPINTLLARLTAYPPDGVGDVLRQMVDSGEVELTDGCLLRLRP